MKILIVGTVPQNLADIKGGVQAVILNMLEGMKSALGLEVSLFSLNKEISRPSFHQFSPHIKIFYFPFGRTRSTKLEMLFHGRRQLKHLAEHIRPDIIHFQGSGSLLLLSLGLDSKKIVITSHGILSEEIKYQKSAKPTFGHLLTILSERLLLKRFRNIIFISDYSKNYYFKKRLVDPDKSFWRVIYNPVALRFFASPMPGLSSPKPLEKPGRMIFIYVGRLVPLKGLDILIRSFEKANNKGLDFELKIIGGWSSPKYERRIRQMASRTGMGGKISFLGWLDQAGVFAELQKASVFVLPSKQENLPISVAEALSMGKFVVASNVGGISEMITHKENGFLFNKGDIDALQEIILDILEGHVDCASMTSNARKRARETFHPAGVAERTVDFYRTLASHPKEETSNE